jgi:hypothetical protein
MAQAETRPAAGERLRATLRVVFGADLRSLAAFRIVLALLALADLAMRAANLTAHYTDAGVLTRADLARDLHRRAHFSLHALSGEAPFIAALFALAAAAAVAMLLGYRTRLATAVVWALMISTQARNPLVGSGADMMLRLLFFWAMFLPLGARWSLDSRRSGAARQGATSFCSLATAGLFLQIAFVYWFGVLLKAGPEWRVDGSALYYALSVDQFATPLGHFLLGFPALLTALTFATWWFEALGPFLLLSPVWNGRLRMLAILGFLGLHLGIWLTMSLGLFQWVAALSMVCFLPAVFWDRAEGWARRSLKSGAGSARRAAQPVGFGGAGGLSPFVMQWARPVGPHALPGHVARFARLAPAVSGFGSRRAAPAAGSDAGRALGSSLATNLFASFFLLCVLLFNLQTVWSLPVPAPLLAAASVTRLDQEWSLFAPSPVRDDGWYIVPGRLRDGGRVDLMGVLRGDFSADRDVSLEKPRPVSATFGDKSWRKYLTGIGWDKERNAEQRAHFGRFLCQEWNRRHAPERQVVRLRMYYMLERTLPGRRSSEPTPKLLAEHRCN